MKSKKNLRKHTRKVKKKFNKQKKYRKNYSRKRENKTVRNTKSKNLKAGLPFTRRNKVAPALETLFVTGKSALLNIRALLPQLPEHLKRGIFKMEKLKNFYDNLKKKPILNVKSKLENTKSMPSDEASVEGEGQLNFSAPLSLIQQCSNLKPKVLALYANPKHQTHPPLLINAEINELFNNNLRLHLIIDAITTSDSLIQNITNIEPEIILYSGHIFPTNPITLFLHNEQNLRRGKLYNIADFIEVLSKNTNIKLVILLACYSYKIIEYLTENKIQLMCNFITIEELAHDSAMLSFLKGCSTKISSIYSEANDNGVNIEQIFEAGIEQFELDKYNIGNPNMNDYGYGKKLRLNVDDRVLIRTDTPSYPLEGTIKSINENKYNVVTQNREINDVGVENIALAVHGTPKLIKKIGDIWKTIETD